MDNIQDCRIKSKHIHKRQPEAAYLLFTHICIVRKNEKNIFLKKSNNQEQRSKAGLPLKNTLN